MKNKDRQIDRDLTAIVEQLEQARYEALQDITNGAMLTEKSLIRGWQIIALTVLIGTTTFIRWVT